MSTQDIKSPFKFIGFLVEESHITRQPKSKEADMTFEINPYAILNSSKKEFHLFLDVHIWEENGRFDAKVKLVGFFDFKEVYKKDDLSTYFYTSAPAIMFPYVRAYISSLTALSGMEAINLPPITMAQYADKLKEQTTEVPEETSEKE